jgi:uncharacterized protein
MRMLHRIARAVLASLLVFGFQPVALSAQDDTSLLPLWEIRQADGPTVFLMGSVHLLRPEVYPLDDGLYEAFDRAGIVAFEMDFRKAQAQAMQLMQRGVFDDGRTLRDVLPADVHAAVVDILQPVGLPEEQIDMLRPWMAALTLTNVVLQAGGYDVAAGIDHHFFERAVTTDQTVIGLETLDDQLKVFEGLSEEQQVKMLTSTLDELDSTVEMLNKATEYWQRGQAEPIAKLLTEAMRDQEELLERLLYERNRNWIPQIEALLAGKENAIVIVGMGHLVGEQSVVEMLQERGHEVTQHQTIGVSAY